MATIDYEKKYKEDKKAILHWLYEKAYMSGTAQRKDAFKETYDYIHKLMKI